MCVEGKVAGRMHLPLSSHRSPPIRDRLLPSEFTCTEPQLAHLRPRALGPGTAMGKQEQATATCGDAIQVPAAPPGEPRSPGGLPGTMWYRGQQRVWSVPCVGAYWLLGPQYKTVIFKTARKGRLKQRDQLNQGLSQFLV